MKTAKSVCSLYLKSLPKCVRNISSGNPVSLLSWERRGNEYLDRMTLLDFFFIISRWKKILEWKKGVVGEERRSSPWWISEHWVTSIAEGGRGGKEISFIIILGARVCVHEQPDLFDRSLLVFQCFMLEHTLLNRMRERKKMSHSNHHASGSGVYVDLILSNMIQTLGGQRLLPHWNDPFNKRNGYSKDRAGWCCVYQ